MTRHVATAEVKGDRAFGLGKGHKTQVLKKNKISRRAGHQNKRVAFVRSVVREVAGFAPYEKRCLELLRVNKDKRALKYCKRKLGTHKRAKAKREEMSNVIVQQRKANLQDAADKKAVADDE